MLLYKNIPINAKGTPKNEPMRVIGITAFLSFKGAYPCACWHACPASWQATPTAATLVASKTSCERQISLFLGS